MRRGRATSAAILLLAACSRPADPGALSAEDERRLNEAAAALDANAVIPGDAGNEADDDDE